MSGHHHDHGPANYNRAFAIGIALNGIYIVIEVIVGLAVNSVALVADAGHNASDVLSLLLAWGAGAMSTTAPTKRRTYGLRRASILASLVNAILLLVSIGAIAWEAVSRFGKDVPVQGAAVAITAAVGIAVNAGTAMLFMKGRKRDINIRGAYLHMAADAGVSAGVMIAGMIIAVTGWFWVDPIVSLIIVAVIAIGTWDLLKDSIDLSMDAVPEGIDPDAVRSFLMEQETVRGVHDLHIWAMSTTETALTAHVVRPVITGEDSDAFLVRMREALHEKFEIGHVTIQVEHGDGSVLCPACETSHA